MNRFANKPASFPQLIKSSWQYYKRYFIAILLLSLVTCIPVHVLQYYVDQLLPGSSQIQLKLLVSLPIMCIRLLQLMSINILLKSAYDSSTVDRLDCLKKTFKQYAGFIWISFLIAIIIVVPFMLIDLILMFLMMLSIYINFTAGYMRIIFGFVLTVVPIVFLFPYLSFTLQAYLFKGKKGIQALKYSFLLVKGQFWRILYLNALIVVMGLAFSYTFTGVTSLLSSAPGSSIVFSTMLSVAAAFPMIYNALLYLDTDETYIPSENPSDTAGIQESQAVE